MTSTGTLRQQRHYAFAVSVGAVIVTVSSAMAALSTSANIPACTMETTCRYPKVQATVRTTVTPRELNPAHGACSVYEVDVTNHITMSPHNQDSGTPAPDSTTAITAPQEFRSKYSSFDGVSYYKLHESQKNWEEADRICKDEGAFLAVINSQEEQQVIRKVLQPFEAAYVGFRYKHQGGYWETVLGDAGAYIDWHESADKGPDLGECGVMWDSGKMINYQCDTTLPFICERRA